METILAFVIILSVVILVHEWGHFQAARSLGVTVEEFGFGFPPRLATLFSHKGTKFSLNWIPFGGFVRLKGESGNDTEGPDAFQRKSAWRRLAILAAGVGMNYILAAVLFSIAFAVGVTVTPDAVKSGATLSNHELVITEVLQDSPATAAGLVAGDRITAVDGTEVSSVSSLQDYQATRADTPIVFSVVHNGEQATRTVTPKVSEGETQPRIGVQLIASVQARYPVHLAIWHGVESTVQLSWQILVSLWTILKNLVVAHTVPADLVGPVGVAALTGQVAKLGIAALLQFAALLSLSLAVMNFLPIPALDGGRALFIVIEKIRGRALNERTEAIIHNVSFYLLILLLIMISIRDVGTFGIVDSVKGLFTR